MVYISPQVVILRALKQKGSLTTREIFAETGISLLRIHSSGKHLVNRSLVTKKTEKFKSFPITHETTWTIREQKKEKIERMIRENYPDDYI